MKLLKLFIISVGFLFSYYSQSAESSSSSASDKTNYVALHVKAMMSTRPDKVDSLTVCNLKKAHDFGVPGFFVLLFKCPAIRNMAKEQLARELGELIPKEGTSEFESKLYDSLLRVVNPARSGLWNEDGTLNNLLFSAACDLAKQLPTGEMIILKKDFERFVEQQQASARKKGLNVDGNATKLIGMIPVPWKTVTSRSIGEMFDSSSDGTKTHMITLNAFKEFYTQPTVYLKRVREIYLRKSMR